MRTKDELWRVLLATTRMPWIGGEPVPIDGRRYIDGALTCPIPVGNAVDAGATHVLILQTRPYGVPRSAGGRVGERLIARYLRRLNPELVPLWHARIEQYEALVDDIARRSAAPNGDGPYLLGLRPPAGTPCVTQLERRPEILARAAADAERLVEQTFAG
jgi:predicted patatin/cPLA2 family phospholipase